MFTIHDIHIRLVRHGLITMYGKNMQMCIPHIDRVNHSVEAICKYCKNHNLKMMYVPAFMFRGLIENIRINRLINKYDVRGNEEDIAHLLPKGF